MTRLQNTAETGLANGTAPSAANSGGSAGNAFSVVTGTMLAYDGTVVNRGAQSIKLETVASPTTTQTVRLGASAGPMVGGTLAARFYFNTSSAASSIAYARIVNDAGGTCCTLRWDGLRRPLLFNSAGSAIGSMGSALAVDTWYRAEVWVTPGTSTTGRATLSIFVGESTTPVYTQSTTTSNLGTLPPRSLEVGRTVATSNVHTIYYDDLAIRDDIGEAFIGPSGNDFDATAASALGALSSSASGTRTVPAFTGTAASALTLASSAAGTTTPPAFTGTASSPLGALISSAAGTFTAGASGTASSALGAISSSATGTRTVPAFTGTAASPLGALASAASGTRTVPAFTGTAASSLGAISSAASGTRTVPAFTGTAASSLGAIASAASGTVAGPPPITGTAASALTLDSAATGTTTAPFATGWGEDFASGVMPFTSGDTFYDTVTGGELVHNSDASLNHRIRRRVVEAFAIGTRVSMRVYLEPGTTRLSGIAFVDPATSNSILVLIDNRNGATGGTTAGLQIRESTSTTNMSSVRPSPIVVVSTWYRLTAWIDAATGDINAELRDDAGALIATLSRTPTLYSPLAWGGFYPGVHAYGYVRNDDYRVGVFDSTAASSLGSITSSATGTTGPKGTATSTLGALSSSATGTRTVPNFTGTASSSLGAISSTATGTRTIPPRTGTAASTLTLTSSATGTRTVPTRTGVATSTLDPITSAAIGEADEPHTIPEVVTLRVEAPTYRLEIGAPAYRLDIDTSEGALTIVAPSYTLSITTD